MSDDTEFDHELRSTSVAPAAWAALRSLTPARIALGRAGVATVTTEALQFGWAHAMARDAIHAPLETDRLESDLWQVGWEVQHARSRVPDRTTYLRRPDLGRQLDPEAAQRLREVAQMRGGRTDLLLVIGDGLSSLAAQRHAVPLLEALRDELPPELQLGPVVVVTQARVAVADEVGEIFGATMAAMLIGERPGLSSPDSLGVYLTHGPRRGRHDAQRNCISNIRPAGLSYLTAARKLAWLIRQAGRLGLTGVALKDESDEGLIPLADPKPKPAIG